ncbi:hypothetical protein MVEN_01042500 [Mycena venus]|uniref:Uncharacterized protein n=1 Tax=Mycena venus TaxID=2733690 RepID=A0A8H7D2J3_9AGAR|nr:hypothetical protein MVEN_01042500 [Mycena venus]
MLSVPESQVSPYPTGMMSPVSAGTTSQLEYWDSPVETEVSYGRPVSSQPSIRPSGAMAPVQSSNYMNPPDDVVDINGSNGQRYGESSTSASAYLPPNGNYDTNRHTPPNDYRDVPPNGYHDTSAYAGPSTSGHRETNGYASRNNYHDPNEYDDANVSRSPTGLLQVISNYNENERGRLELHDEEEDEYWDEEEEDDETRFINFSLLSHVAVQFRDKVPRGTHVKGSIPYPRAFTGKDVVTTIQSQIQRDLAINHGISTNDRRAALQVAQFAEPAVLL